MIAETSNSLSKDTSTLPKYDFLFQGVLFEYPIYINLQAAKAAVTSDGEITLNPNV